MIGMIGMMMGIWKWVRSVDQVLVAMGMGMGVHRDHELALGGVRVYHG